MEGNLYFSNKLLDIMIRGFHFGKYLAAHPYSYNANTKTFSRVSKLKLHLWYLHVAFTFTHFLFVIGRWMQVQFDVSAREETRLVMQFMIVFYAFPNIFNLAFLTVGTEVSDLPNVGLSFFRAYSPYAKQEYWTQKGKLTEIWIAEVLLELVFYWFTMFHLSTIVFANVLPETPVFLSSLIDDPLTKTSIPLRILSNAVTIYLASCYCAQGYVLLNCIVAVTFGLLPALSHLSLGKPARERWRDDIHWYTQIRLVVETLNRGYGQIMLPGSELVFITLSVYGVYAAVKLSGTLQLVIVSVGLLAYTLLIVLFRSLAEYWKRSEDLLALWRRSPDAGTRGRLLRSLKPIRIKLNGNFIDIPIILTLTDVVVNNSITLLLL